MSRRKRIPENSKLTRDQPLAYARTQKPGDRGDGGPAGEDDVQVKKDDKGDAPKVVAEAKADATSEKPTEPHRARVDTIAIPVDQVLGSPPDMPTAVTAAIVVTPPDQPTAITTPIAGSVEEPTNMPGPRDIPSGTPDDLAPPPGMVPAGDSRSLRRRGGDNQYDFALIYRRGNAVISRFGAVGTRGQWRVVEYPTTASASHAYAKESSRFVSEGFSDYRD
ncbi:MAG: hypothetical protein ABI867_39370 [Kofleriaceae bacterium]